MGGEKSVSCRIYNALLRFMQKIKMEGNSIKVGKKVKIKGEKIRKFYTRQVRFSKVEKPFPKTKKKASRFAAEPAEINLISVSFQI